jgi:hypothetical protein
VPGPVVTGPRTVDALEPGRALECTSVAHLHVYTPLLTKHVRPTHISARGRPRGDVQAGHVQGQGPLLHRRRQRDLQGHDRGYRALTSTHTTLSVNRPEIDAIRRLRRHPRPQVRLSRLPRRRVRVLTARARMDRLEAAAQELAAKTGQKCIPLQADVRMPAQLQAAAKRAVEELGKIDFVICGMPLYLAP